LLRKLIAIALLGASPMLVAEAGQKTGKPGRFKDSRSEGAWLYKRNCAVCHGNDAEGGNAPKSALFTAPAPNLTTLAKRHKGKFPEAYVTTILESGVQMPDHGTSEMPIWGTIFKAGEQSSEAEVNKRIAALVAYLKYLQVK
jgi:mono/diheme cytochrome c family protein